MHALQNTRQKFGVGKRRFNAGPALSQLWYCIQIATFDLIWFHRKLDMLKSAVKPGSPCLMSTWSRALLASCLCEAGLSLPHVYMKPGSPCLMSTWSRALLVSCLHEAGLSLSHVYVKPGSPCLMSTWSRALLVSCLHEAGLSLSHIYMKLRSPCLVSTKQPIIATKMIWGVKANHIQQLVIPCN